MEVRMGGVRTAYADVAVGTRFEPMPFSIDDAALDAALEEYGQWFECFACAGPDGRRLITPVLLAPLTVAASPIDFKGIAAGADAINRAYLYVDEPYELTLSVDEKYERRGLNYAWMRGDWCDSRGVLVHTYRWLQVVSLLDRETPTEPPHPRDVSGLDAADLDEFPYLPPPPLVRVAAEWHRAEAPTPNPGYLPSDALPGYRLAPESTRFTWRRARDFSEYGARRTNRSRAHAAYNHHSHSSAARERGLPGGVVSALNLDPLLDTMFVRACGPDWLRTGTLRCRYLRLVGFEDLVVCDAHVTERADVADGAKLTFDVAARNQRGETVIAGTACVFRAAGQ
jgi:hypothetical protein